MDRLRVEEPGVAEHVVDVAIANLAAAFHERALYALLRVPELAQAPAKRLRHIQVRQTSKRKAIAIALPALFVGIVNP